MKQICLIRHGKTEGNMKRQYIGRTDEPLCAEGRGTLVKAAKNGRYPSAELLFVSPMLRCLETAALIYPNQPHRIETELRECDFGLFEGKTYEELKELPSYRAFLDSEGMGEIPNGESLPQMKARCRQAFLSIVNEMEKEGCHSASIVCHGGTIMSILEAFSEKPKSFYDYQIENGGGYLCTFEEEKECFTAIEKL